MKAIEAILSCVSLAVTAVAFWLLMLEMFFWSMGVSAAGFAVVAAAWTVARQALDAPAADEDEQSPAALA